MTSETVRRSISRVVEAGNCSGCGACAEAFDGVEMALDGEGFLRPGAGPVSVELGMGPPPPAIPFEQFCPGVGVRSAPRRASDDVLVGSSLGVWQGWATDPAIRQSGSSGGVLTAIADWLVGTGRKQIAVGVGSSDVNAIVTAVRVATTTVGVREMAGSRYAPVGVASEPDAYRDDAVVVGKPCEVTAIRRRQEGRSDSPLLLSFFCAGVPSQAASVDLAEKLGLDTSRPLASLRYRGDGWPGRFVARDADGREGALSYEASWGEHLGKRLQWRCKVCVDGVGDDADIVAADYWQADERGFPVFGEAAGRSVVIAKTTRGLDTLLAARDAGVIELQPIEASSVSSRQPYQVRRRVTLLGRLLGARLAGRPTPKYVGFGLLRWTLMDPLRTAHDGIGSWTRSRRFRQTVGRR
ncbi:Coenzyme F420 hydrogenase/dehydrogenase, beta subunit C-terminal domain [Cellulomonas sp.]|uniref:Coenzyme F420 hydrogenase/dehydrogenase, beta subunit C-terminal domain n=1 Tax=Cellulomonas sp. TaxID=40001 RepID=UPI003BA925D8